MSSPSYWNLDAIEVPLSTDFAGLQHHILILDQSGSMHWAVKQLAEDCIAHIERMSAGSIATIGYFSGVGDFRWWVIGYALNGDDSRARLYKLLRDNARSRNTTCFSEILADLNQVLAQTETLADSVSLAFLTDGHPVVPDYPSEEKSIFAAIADVNDKLSSALVVGYGEYYNRELLRRVAEAFGGGLQHLEKIEYFAKELDGLMLVKGSRVTVEVPGGATMVYVVQEDGRVALLAPRAGKVRAPRGSRVMYAGRAPLRGKEMSDREAYELALAHLQGGHIDDALRVLSDLGDAFLVTQVANALTNAELGAVADRIHDAIVDPSARFLVGRRVDCLPDEHAFDLLDALSLLQDDPDALFYPHSELWEYKRIGPESKPKGNYPRFHARNVGVPFGTLTWNESELNLSVLATIPGTVTFPDAAAAAGMGFDRSFETVAFRNYALVSNCYPNVPVIPASMSRITFEQLREVGMIDARETYSQDCVYAVRVNAVPVCNRGKSAAGYSSRTLAESVVRAKLLAGRINGLNALLRELDPEGERRRDKNHTAEQDAFLQSMGIINGAYSPETEKQDHTDEMWVRVFEFKLQKFSSFPKLEAVRAMAAKGKFTPTGEIVWKGVTEFHTQGPVNGAKQEKMDWLKLRIADHKRERRQLVEDLNRTRFAMALGNRWFSDKSSRDDNVTEVTVDGVKYTVEFVFKSRKKEI